MFETGKHQQQNALLGKESAMNEDDLGGVHIYPGGDINIPIHDIDGIDVGHEVPLVLKPAL